MKILLTALAVLVIATGHHHRHHSPTLQELLREDERRSDALCPPAKELLPDAYCGPTQEREWYRLHR